MMSQFRNFPWSHDWNKYQSLLLIMTWQVVVLTCPSVCSVCCRADRWTPPPPSQHRPDPYTPPLHTQTGRRTDKKAAKQAAAPFVCVHVCNLWWRWAGSEPGEPSWPREEGGGEWSLPHCVLIGSNCELSCRTTHYKPEGRHTHTQ